MPCNSVAVMRARPARADLVRAMARGTLRAGLEAYLRVALGERANVSAPDGTVTASECHCIHGPLGIASGMTLSMSWYQPISGTRAGSTVPPSAAAID